MWGKGGFWDTLMWDAILVVVVYTVGHAASWITLDLTTWMDGHLRKLAVSMGVYVLGAVIAMVTYFAVSEVVE
jgi:hypothetical protein